MQEEKPLAQTEIKKVVERGGRFCTVHCSGPKKGQVIKCFDTREQALAQHRAIEANKSISFYTDTIQPEIVETKEGKEHYIEGYISTSDLDSGNDIVTDECLDDMVMQIKGRNISTKLDVEHEAWKGDEENKNLIPIGKIIEAKRDQNGIWVRAILNKHLGRFKEVWGSIKDGYLDAFSIAYQVVDKVTKELTGKTVQLLKKIHLLNVALTGIPMNEGAKLTYSFTKSVHDAVTAEPLRSSGDIIVLDVKSLIDKMSDEKPMEAKKKPVEETKDEEAPTGEEAPKKETPAPEGQPEGEGDAPAEGAETKTLITGLQKQVKSLEGDVAELKAKLKAPVMKSTIEQMPKAEAKAAEYKSVLSTL